MSYKNKYRELYSSSLRDSHIKANIHMIDYTLRDHPNYKRIKIDGVEIDSRVDIEKYQGKEGSTVRVFPLPDYKINIGSLCEIDDRFWLVIDRKVSDVHTSGVAKLCNWNLKWQNEDGSIGEQLCAVTSRTIYKDGSWSDKFMTLPTGEYHVYLPKNELTDKFKINQRFIITKNSWKVVFIDDITEEGLIVLTVDKDSILPSDNFELGIANYINPNYSIRILNGNYIQTDIYTSIQINVEVKNGDTVVENPQVIYTIDDDATATISEDGLLSPTQEGSVIITAEFMGNKANIEIDVVAAITDNYRVEIIGNDYVYMSGRGTFKCEFFNNSTPYDDFGIFSITGDDGVSPTSLATIESQSSNECVIRAGKNTGWIRLYIKNSNGDLENYKRIQIRSLI